MTENTDVFAPVEDTRPVHKFEFSGEFRELLPIALVNLFFNIITLSLYRFWGRTRVRRYLWSRTSVMGDPFEYTGNGKELFIGFVVVLLLIFAPFYGLIFFGQTLIIKEPVIGGLMMTTAYVVLLFLFGLGWYRAQKFRLSRTRWRGIRGGLKDNGVKYGFKFLGLMLLNFLTMGITAPFAANKLWSEESNTRRFGTAKFFYYGFSSQFYGRFFGAIGIYLVMAAILIGLMALTTIGAALSGGQGSPGQLPEVGGAQIFVGVIVYIGFLFAMTLAYTFYQFGKLRVFWNHTKLENAEFVFTGTMGGLMKMIIGNFFIEIFTFGILHPIAQMRWLRYFVNSLEIHGDIDLEAIAQREGEAMSYGEGLAEGFDFGGI